MNTDTQHRAEYDTDVPTFHVRVAVRSEKGVTRDRNEDAFVVADLTGGTVLESPAARVQVGSKGLLLAVADGMGGNEAGEVASALVVQTLRRALDKGAEMDHAPRRKILKNAVESANRVTHQAGIDRKQYGPRRMGATLTAAYLIGGYAYFAEVGDSRAYLLRAGELTQLTKDQSIVQSLIDDGIITKEGANDSPFKNVILQAMGLEEHIHLAMSKLALRDRDCILLCSDGLTGVVSEKDTREAILSSGTLEGAASKLLTMVIERDGPDDVTFILAGVGGFLKPASDGETVESTHEVISSFDPKRRKRHS